MQRCVFKKIFCVIITSFLCCSLQAVQLNKLSRFFTLAPVLMQRKIKSLYNLKQFKKIKNFDKWQSKFQSKYKYFKKNKKLNKVLLASPAFLGLLQLVSTESVVTVMELFTSSDCTVMHTVASGGCGGIVLYLINEQQKRMKEERSKQEDAYWASREKALRSDGCLTSDQDPGVVIGYPDSGFEELPTYVYCEDLKCWVYKFLTHEEAHKRSMQELKRAREAGEIPETSVYNHLTHDGFTRIPVVYQLPIIKELKDGGINGAMSAIVTNHPINNPNSPDDELLGGGLIATKKKKGDRGVVKEDGRVTVPEKDKKADYPGKPNAEVGYHPPKKWDGQKVKVEKGKFKGKKGFPDKGGRIWVPTGHGANAHGGPHWDVQYPGGKRYRNKPTPSNWKYGEYAVKLEDVKQEKLFKVELPKNVGIIIKNNQSCTDSGEVDYDSSYEDNDSHLGLFEDVSSDSISGGDLGSESPNNSSSLYIGDHKNIFDSNNELPEDVGIKVGSNKYNFSYEHDSHYGDTEDDDDYCDDGIDEDCSSSGSDNIDLADGQDSGDDASENQSDGEPTEGLSSFLNSEYGNLFDRSDGEDE